MQDVRPRERKSTIQDVQIARPKTRTRTTSKTSSIEDKKQIPPVPMDLIEKRAPGAPKWFMKGVILGAFVLSLLVLAGLFTFFGSGARVSVTLKERAVSINDVIAFGGESGIKYEVMTTSKEGVKSVPTTGEKQVERKASGTVVIYNDYSSASQRLIKNTRFETPEGLIFRIDSSVVVPGVKTVNGETTPGSIEAVIYADEVGEKYNIGLSDFTVPGFKGDPRYDKFYARSKTAMTGGFSGLVKTASEEDISKAKMALEEELTNSLKKEASSEIPQGFVALPSLTFFETENLSDTESSEVKVKVTERVILVDSFDFGREIAMRTLADFDSRRETLVVKNLDTLTISLQSPDIRPWQETTWNTSISGNPTLSWRFDEGKLAEDLSGVPKARMTEILSAYPGIEKAEATIRPFFKSSFPEDSEKIRVEVAN